MPQTPDRGRACRPVLRIAAALAMLSLAPATAPSHGRQAYASDTGAELRAAAARGDVMRVQSLLAGGAEADARDANEVSPLLVAAISGHADVARALLDHGGADVNAEGLVRAALVIGGNGQIEAASWLHATPLLVATEAGDSEMVALLLDHGADAGFATREGVSALLRAAFEGRAKIARLLLDHGADPSSAEAVWAELLVAEGLGEDEGVEAGADITISPLHAAAHRGHPMVVAALLDHGADADARMNGIFTALSLAARAGHSQTVKRLLDGGADVNAADDAGMTPLHLAIYEGRGTVAATLLEHGADVKARSDEGATPLIAAIANDDTRTARRLLDAGADLHVETTEGLSLLHVAAEHGHRPALAFLIEHGLDVNAAAASKRVTALHVAAREGQADAVVWLLDHGADSARRTRNGMTPLDLAADANHAGVATLLRARGAPAGAGNSPGVPRDEGLAD